MKKVTLANSVVVPFYSEAELAELNAKAEKGEDVTVPYKVNVTVPGGREVEVTDYAYSVLADAGLVPKETKAPAKPATKKKGQSDEDLLGE